MFFFYDAYYPLQVKQIINSLYEEKIIMKKIKKIAALLTLITVISNVEDVFNHYLNNEISVYSDDKEHPNPKN